MNLSNIVASYSATYSVTVSNPVGTISASARLAVVTPSGYPPGRAVQAHGPGFLVHQ